VFVGVQNVLGIFVYEAEICDVLSTAGSLAIIFVMSYVCKGAGIAQSV
jgi:hypothetical protein